MAQPSPGAAQQERAVCSATAWLLIKSSFHKALKALTSFSDDFKVYCDGRLALFFRGTSLNFCAVRNKTQT